MLENQLKYALNQAKRFRGLVEGKREPIYTLSVGELMDLADKRDSSQVYINPSVIICTNTRTRNRLGPEYNGRGFYCPPFITEYLQSGQYQLRTEWNARAPGNRRIGFNQVYQLIESYKLEAGISTEEAVNRARDEQFRLALIAAERQHKINSQLEFLVTGSDGPQEYQYYKDRLDNVSEMSRTHDAIEPGAIMWRST